MLKIGINSNNDCGNDYKEILDNIKNAGFDNVMLSARSGDSEQLLNYAQKIGLNVPFFHINYTNASDLWVQGKSHDKYIQFLKSQIEILGKYKVPIAIIHATMGEASLLALKPNKYGLKSMLDVLDVAEKNNVKIAVENCDKPNFRAVKYLLKNIKSKWFGFCYDAGHHNLYIPKRNLLKKYGDRLLAVHLHDNLMDWKYGYDYSRDMHYLPGDGKIDYKKVCKNLAKAKYSGVIMCEVRKSTIMPPYVYKDLSVQEFLQQVKLRAEDIAKEVEGNHNN